MPQELLPLRPGRNAPLALVLGDASGIVSLFEPTGEMLAEFDSGAALDADLCGTYDRALVQFAALWNCRSGDGHRVLQWAACEALAHLQVGDGLAEGCSPKWPSPTCFNRVVQAAAR